MLSFGARNSRFLATAITPIDCPRGLGEGLGVGPQVFHPQGLPEPRDGSRPPGGHGPWGGGGRRAIPRRQTADLPVQYAPE